MKDRTELKVELTRWQELCLYFMTYDAFDNSRIEYPLEEERQMIHWIQKLNDNMKELWHKPDFLRNLDVVHWTAGIIFDSPRETTMVRVVPMLFVTKKNLHLFQMKMLNPNTRFVDAWSFFKNNVLHAEGKYCESLQISDVEYTKIFGTDNLPAQISRKILYDSMFTHASPIFGGCPPLIPLEYYHVNESDKIRDFLKDYTINRFDGDDVNINIFESDDERDDTVFSLPKILDVLLFFFDGHFWEMESCSCSLNSYARFIRPDFQEVSKLLADRSYFITRANYIDLFFTVVHYFYHTSEVWEMLVSHVLSLHTGSEDGEYETPQEIVLLKKCIEIIRIIRRRTSLRPDTSLQELLESLDLM